LPPPPAPPLRLSSVGPAQYADAAELALNPRARSAVLRVAERLP
jgi:16S rRNA (cytosine1402-N4)-methyltransferase